jgi:GWxTD domain-containing protein
MRSIIAGLFVLAIFLTSCRTVNEITVQNLSWLYDAENQMGMKCVTVNLNDSVSMAFLETGPSETDIDLAKADTLQQGFKLKYVLYKSWSTSVIVDSGTVVYDFPGNRELSEPFMTNFSFHAPSGQDYLLFIKVLVRKTHSETTLIREVLKKNDRSVSWYLVNDQSGEPMETSYLSKGEPVDIQFFGPLKSDFAVSKYGHNFPPALPPFATELRQKFDYLADSGYAIPSFNGKMSGLSFRSRGMFFIQSDTSHPDGLTIHRYYDGYPAVNSPMQMVEAVRYITSNKEYEKLLGSPDTKAAIDSFWIATGGNVARGVELIRKYYGRVEDANRYFTSFCEGWKTDRGMIYIVFGQPNIVYRNGSQEEWIYGEARNYRSVHFHFFRVENPFSDNDYVLQRQPNYKEFWYMAVQQWRR